MYPLNNMKKYENHKDIIDLWESIAEFSRDINVKYEAAKKMYYRRRISPSHWPAVISAATSRGFSQVNLPVLMDLYQNGEESSAS